MSDSSGDDRQESQDSVAGSEKSPPEDTATANGLDELTPKDIPAVNEVEEFIHQAGKTVSSLLLTSQ